MATDRIALSPLARLAWAGVIAAAAACAGNGPTDSPTEPTRSAAGEEGAPSQPASADLPVGATEVPSAEVDTIFRSTVSGVTAARRQVVRSGDEWAAAWTQVSGSTVPTVPPPDVDFAASRVLVLGMGLKPTGGYEIDVLALGHAEGVLHAVVVERSPGAGCVTTQATTQPVLVIGVPTVADSVAFVEERAVRDCS